MSNVTESNINNVEDIIEFCPETFKEESTTNCTGSKLLIQYIRDHLKTQTIFVCILCLRQYELEEDLRGHLIEYHQYQPIRTPSVSKNVNASKDSKNFTKVAFSRTLLINNDISLGPFKEFRRIIRSKLIIDCPVTTKCSYRFENEHKLHQHMNCHVRGQRTFKCFICSMEIINWRQCSIHLWKVHQVNVDLLKCPICDFQSYASVFVWRHMCVHKAWRKQVIRSLKRSETRKQQIEQVRIKKENANRTKNMYYSEKLCHVCNRRFVNGKTLSKHIKSVHNKIKLFLCNVCGKKLGRKDSLIIHMRQHTGEKPFQCNVCKFSTRDPSVLRKHRLTHDKLAQFYCTYCSYTCIQSSAFKRHIRLTHREYFKKISCNLCSFITINEDKLRVHKEDHRKGLIRKDGNEIDQMTCKELIKKNEALTNSFISLESNHNQIKQSGDMALAVLPNDCV